MIKVDNIKLNIGFDDKDVERAIAKKLKIASADIKSWDFVKLSIDARRKPNVFYVANIALTLANGLETKFSHLKFHLDKTGLEYKTKHCDLSPVVVGFGPSGMFCALALAKMGLKPIVIEQGKCVEEREKDVENFWNNRVINKYSNVQFGEGGAGTFSDGKLNTNLNSPLCRKVLNEFYLHGAPKEILYLAKPHIGSDNLKNIVKSIRKEIIALGGKIYFNHKLIDISVKNSSNIDIKVLNIDTNLEIMLNTDKLILALGHSARDTFYMLKNVGLNINKKPFAVGVRIECRQEDINQAQYGKGYDKRLPSADYKLVEHLDNGRSVFTFCMCPGGEVVASSSDENEIVTNGMSNFKRDKDNANSAILVNVIPSDFESEDVMAGIEFQRKYERLAFEIGGKDYNAPCETVGSFLYDEKIKNILPTYKPNVTWTKIKNCLPDFVYESLKLALPRFDKKIKGFAKKENILTAIETRSSCPITLLRDESFQSNIKGVYPIGEGAGYAGGIMTSAVDGIRVAESIYKSL